MVKGFLKENAGRPTAALLAGFLLNRLWEYLLRRGLSKYIALRRLEYRLCLGLSKNTALLLRLLTRRALLIYITLRFLDVALRLLFLGFAPTIITSSPNGFLYLLYFAPEV